MCTLLLKQLEDAGIPVTICMGNHDRRSTFLEVHPSYAKRTLVPGRIVTVCDAGAVRACAIPGTVIWRRRDARRTRGVSGNLRLVKEGAGTFVGGKSGQKYGGGTVVAGGTARPRTGVQNKLTYYEAQYFFGGEYSKLTIESGAVFDIAGHFAYRVHDIVLNGGTSSPRTSRSCWTRRAATARNAAFP